MYKSSSSYKVINDVFLAVFEHNFIYFKSLHPSESYLVAAIKAFYIFHQGS